MNECMTEYIMWNKYQQHTPTYIHALKAARHVHEQLQEAEEGVGPGEGAGVGRGECEGEALLAHLRSACSNTTLIYSLLLYPY